MALEVNWAVIAAARFSQYAAADGNGAWIVSTHPARLFSHSQAALGQVPILRGRPPSSPARMS